MIQSFLSRLKDIMSVPAGVTEISVSINQPSLTILVNLAQGEFEDINMTISMTCYAIIIVSLENLSRSRQLFRTITIVVRVCRADIEAGAIIPFDHPNER